MKTPPWNPIRLLAQLFLLLALATVCAAATSEKFPGLGKKWHYYHSVHFEMYSQSSDYESREVLDHMELLRAVFLDSFKLKVRVAQPVTIFYFDSDRDFHGYWPLDYAQNANLAGFCDNQMDRTVISLAPADGVAGRRTVYHEYIHYLFRITELTPPPWYNEGMAELFSTIEEDYNEVIMGLPIESSVLELRQDELIPLGKLFAIKHDSSVFNDSAHAGLFYAESWAFLHYCHYGLPELSPDRLDQFLHLAGQSKTQDHPEILRRACRELLGYDYPQLEQKLKRYVVAGRFHKNKMTRPRTEDPRNYLVRPVPPNEMLVRLAELSCRITRGGLARLTLLRAEDHNLADARLREVLGNDAWLDGDRDLARERWNQAIELGSTNPAIYRELGELEAERWFGQFDVYFRLPEPQVDRLRSLLQRSVDCAPDQSSAYEIMAWVEATAAKPSPANLNLVQRHLGTLNDQPHTLLALAWGRARLKDRPAALQLLDQVDKMQPSPRVAQVAGIIRTTLDNPVGLDGAVPEVAKPGSR